MQFCSHATLQLCSLAAMQPCSRVACNLAALQPCSLQPCSLAAMQLCSCAALQHQCAAWQPQATALQLHSLSVLKKPQNLRHQQQPYSPATNQKPRCPSRIVALQLQAHVVCLYYMYKRIGIINIRMSCNVASGTPRKACKACNDAVSLALCHNMTCSCVSTGLQ